VLVGPGLGLGPGVGVPDDLCELVVRMIPALRNRKVVVDADGLNAIAGRDGVLGPHVAITPHRGEFRRLAGVDATADTAAAFAAAHQCVVVVKGPIDIVSGGARTRLNHTGNPGMATGGTGDVLSGALAAFAARNDLFLAACAAAYVTGLAGDLVKEERGEHFTASDVVEMLGRAIRRAEQS
jgi:NAD(P)H-hydrate epimerase